MNEEPATELMVQPERPTIPQLAALAARSDLVPRCYQDKPADTAIAMEFGRELGLAPLQALQSVAVIGGKPSLYGDGLLAVVLASPLCEWVNETLAGEGDDRVATCEAKRRGWPKAVVRTFTPKDAKQARLWGKPGPWSEYPGRMLSMRARSFCLRDCFADGLAGISMAEEVADYVDGEPRTIVDIDRATPTTRLLAPPDNGAPDVRDADPCRPEQRLRIVELFKQLNVPQAAAKAAVQRRGVVNLAGLSDGQADSLIHSLTERLSMVKCPF